MSDHSFYKLKVDLPLETANSIIDAAIAAGRDKGYMPLTVAVLDNGGHLVALKREDGSGVLRGDMAVAKAWGALGIGLSSRGIHEKMAERPVFLGALAAVSDGRFLPVPGGVLVLDAEDRVIGVVGISGDNSDQDEYCAIAGIKQAGLKCAPATSDLA